MTKNAFIKLLTELAGETKEFNTNNAWGFGGGSGTRFVIDDKEEDKLIISVGVASSRHQGSHPYITARIHRLEGRSVTLVDCHDTFNNRKHVAGIANSRKS